MAAVVWQAERAIATEKHSEICFEQAKRSAERMLRLMHASNDIPKSSGDLGGYHLRNRQALSDCLNLALNLTATNHRLDNDRRRRRNQGRNSLVRSHRHLADSNMTAGGVHFADVQFRETVAEL